MSFTWNTYNKPIIALAPMANITTLPFRSICREMGANLVYTPMLSSNAIVHNEGKTLKIASFFETEQPVIVQIFGYDGEIIAKAVNIAQNVLKCAGIDINMGCPAPKITGNECGSALLRDLDKSAKLIEKVRNNYDGELSVKLRLGWDAFDILEFVKVLEKIGINAVSIHGRTAKQGYRGRADWDAIYQIADSVNIPVVGNGDIDSRLIAIEKLANTKLAGIMIGRAALGNPWLFKSIVEDRDIIPSKQEVSEVIMLQTNRSIGYLGEPLATKEMRKHLCWYLKDFDGAKELRKKAVKVFTEEDVVNLLSDFKNID